MESSVQTDFDAVITGGGLAGLTLARQLHREAPHIGLLVLDKLVHPVPEAAFKVGESSVEIGAHYFGKVLGLEPHLKSAQLDKLGLRYFFPHEGNHDLRRRAELGPSKLPRVPSYQLDRGRLENFLLQSLRDDGVQVVDGVSVQQITLDQVGHTVTYGPRGGETRSVTARWVLDASGRSGLIRRKLGLTREVPHGACASWFRVNTRVKVDDWVASPEWRARVPDGTRWLSTNHLMGRGYWVWLIPLGSGSTSIGIVADAAIHPFNRFNRYERALDWLREFEPQCAKVVEALEDPIEDFLALRHYAYGCERVASGTDRWALVGEAGLFTDPFYSPGSDFIAIGNDCVTDIVIRDLQGEDITARTEAFNTTYLRLYDAFLRLYTNQYALMGNAQVMTAKASWDNGCYWAISALLFFERRYRRPEFMATIEPLMRRFFLLHVRMQQFLNAWDVASQHTLYADAAANIIAVEELRRLQAALDDGPMDDDTLRAKLDENYALLERFARSWQTIACKANPELARIVSDEGATMDLSALEMTPVGAMT